jgi:hypothetical protein
MMVSALKQSEKLLTFSNISHTGTGIPDGLIVSVINTVTLGAMRATLFVGSSWTPNVEILARPRINFTITRGIDMYMRCPIGMVLSADDIRNKHERPNTIT